MNKQEAKAKKTKPKRGVKPLGVRAFKTLMAEARLAQLQGLYGTAQLQDLYAYGSPTATATMQGITSWTPAAEAASQEQEVAGIWGEIRHHFFGQSIEVLFPNDGVSVWAHWNPDTQSFRAYLGTWPTLTRARRAIVRGRTP